MAKEKFKMKDYLHRMEEISKEINEVTVCLLCFSLVYKVSLLSKYGFNASYEAKERLKNSLEKAHGSIAYFLQEYEHPLDVKDDMIDTLEVLLDVSERLSFTSIGGGYNVSYDIHQTIRCNCA